MIRLLILFHFIASQIRLLNYSPPLLNKQAQPAKDLHLSAHQRFTFNPVFSGITNQVIKLPGAFVTVMITNNKLYQP